MIVKAQNISKSYDKKTPILKKISLEVKKGESVAILGPSGVGKSTLLHILGTLESPSTGTLEIMGHQALASTCAHLRNKHIGFVFQNFNLLEELTVLENVLMPAKIARSAINEGSAAFQYALHLIDQVGLTEQIHQQAKHLSGGEKQRTSIARAFCNHPDLILADEPSGNLDENNSKVVHELLLDAARQFGQSLIVVTHNETLANLCTRQYLLSQGVLTSL